MKYHKESKHEITVTNKAKLFICEVCGKQCKEHQVMKVQMKSHTNTKPFTCERRPKIFNV